MLGADRTGKRNLLPADPQQLRLFRLCVNRHCRSDRHGFLLAQAEPRPEHRLEDLRILQAMGVPEGHGGGQKTVTVRPCAGLRYLSDTSQKRPQSPGACEVLQRRTQPVSDPTELFDPFSSPPPGTVIAVHPTTNAAAILKRILDDADQRRAVERVRKRRWRAARSPEQIANYRARDREAARRRRQSPPSAG